MEEENVRKVVSQYFRKRNQEFTQERGAGPDFLKKGKAVEVKGSGFNQREALEQLTRYIFKYAGVEFAFPVEDLTPELIYGLRAIERGATSRALIEKRDIYIYLITQIDDITFGVETFDSAQKLMEKLNNTLDAVCSVSSSLNLEDSIERCSEMATGIWQELLNELAKELAREYNRITLTTKDSPS